MLTGVLDANVVIGLVKGEVFALLASVYSPLYIPTAISQEIIGQGGGRPGVWELTQALGTWITEVIPDPQTMQQFTAPTSVADREVLAIARDKSVDHILTSDDRLNREANRHGFTSLQTTEVIVTMKRHGLVTEVREILDRMRQRGFGIDDDIYESTLRAAGE